MDSQKKLLRMNGCFLAGVPTLTKIFFTYITSLFLYTTKFTETHEMTEFISIIPMYEHMYNCIIILFFSCFVFFIIFYLYKKKWPKNGTTSTGTVATVMMGCLQRAVSPTSHLCAFSVHKKGKNIYLYKLPLLSSLPYFFTSSAPEKKTASV